MAVRSYSIRILPAERGGRRVIRNEERGGVGLGVLDGDAGSSTADEGSHPVADGRRHRAHSARGCTSTSEV
jgi:hypothetical protein